MYLGNQKASCKKRHSRRDCFFFFGFSEGTLKIEDDNDKQHTNNHHTEISMVVEMLL